MVLTPVETNRDHKQYLKLIAFEPFPEISTERLDLRAWGREHAAEIFELRTNELVNKHSGRPRPKDMNDVFDFIEKIKSGIANNEMISWGIFHKGKDTLLGSLGYWKFNADKTEAHIGYELHPEYWRKGIMQEVFAATLPFAVDQMKLKNIHAIVSIENEASLLFLQKNNFKKIRKLPAEEMGEASDTYLCTLSTH